LTLSPSASSRENVLVVPPARSGLVLVGVPRLVLSTRAGVSFDESLKALSI
jgi:hypothetical protein